MGAPEIAPAIAAQLPQWVGYALIGLGSLVGILGAFVLGLIKFSLSQRGGVGDDRSRGDDRTRRDCSDCAANNRVLAGLNALNSRIDRILELKAGGQL